MKINSLQGFYHTKCPPRQFGRYDDECMAGMVASEQ